MSSNGSEAPTRAATTVVAGPTRGVPRNDLLPRDLDRSEAMMALARGSIARVEQEVDLLWRHAMTTMDLALSERLADVTHALRRAARLLERSDGIG
jgi:hypothetical protein